MSNFSKLTNQLNFTWFPKKGIPTDLRLMEEIYKRCYSTFFNFIQDNPPRNVKVYVPIDFQAFPLKTPFQSSIPYSALSN